MMKNILFAFLMGLLVVACSESSNSVEPSPENDKITFASGTNLLPAFDVEGGTVSISFTASKSWTASLVNNRADGWCKVEPSSGSSGINSITIKVSPNEEPDDKSAIVQIKSGNATETINVSQKQKNALTLTSNKYEVDAEGGSVEIEVKANVKYSYSVDEAAKEWIVYESSRTLTTSYLKFKISPNESLTTREGTITISDGVLSETVTIYQQGEKPSIIISQKDYTIDADADTIQVEVSSNVNVEIQMPDVNWIAENQSRAYSTNTYHFLVSANDTYDNRSAEIIFKNTENNLEEKVVINQIQRDAIVLAKNEYTLEKEASHLDFEVQANVAFEVKVESDWIKQVESRGLESHSLYFDVAENTGDDEREGKIFISSGDIEQVIKVIQRGKSVDVEKYSDVMMFVDTDLTSEYEVSLLNTKKGNLTIMNFDDNGILSELICLSNSFKKTALCHFYKNGLIESIALDSCTIVFSNYKGNNVDITFVKEGDVSFSKTVETETDWGKLSLPSSFVFPFGNQVSRNVILDIDKWLLENEEMFKKLFHTIDQFTNIKNVLNIKELPTEQIEVIDHLVGIIKQSVADYTLFELEMSDNGCAKAVSFIADVIEFIWENVGSWQYKTLKLLLTNYSTYSKFCEDVAFYVIKAIDEWNNPNREVGKGTCVRIALNSYEQMLPPEHNEGKISFTLSANVTYAQIGADVKEWGVALFRKDEIIGKFPVEKVQEESQCVNLGFEISKGDLNIDYKRFVARVKENVYSLGTYEILDLGDNSVVVYGEVKIPLELIYDKKPSIILSSLEIGETTTINETLYNRNTMYSYNIKFDGTLFMKEVYMYYIDFWDSPDEGRKGYSFKLMDVTGKITSFEKYSTKEILKTFICFKAKTFDYKEVVSDNYLEFANNLGKFNVSIVNGHVGEY